MAAWRHVYPGNIRDIAFARAGTGGSFAPPVRVSADEWQLDGCPEDGPAIAVDAKGRTHMVWPTLASEQGAPAFELFYAMSVDDLASRERGEGQTFTARERNSDRRHAASPGHRRAAGWFSEARLGRARGRDPSRRVCARPAGRVRPDAFRSRSKS